MGLAMHYAKPDRARWTMEYITGKGWRLVDPDGKPQSAFYTKDRAQTALDAAQARTDAERKRCRRRCLCCGGEFQSEGIHNRMCDTCRHRDMAPDGLGRLRPTHLRSA
jgi:hypothetical protein